MELSYSVNGGTAQPVITTEHHRVHERAAASMRSASASRPVRVAAATCMKLRASRLRPDGARSSVAGTALQPDCARIEAGTQLYLAYYHANNWWGELTAQTMGVDAKTGKFTINTAANWDASCTLTGGLARR